jgi:PAS domain S-box-containing protein
MQQTLDSYERRYRMLYEATPAMLHSIDSQGRLVHVSDLWLATLGYARDEVIGHLLADFLTPASRAYATGTVIPELFRTGHYKGVEYEAVHKDGTVIDIIASSFIQRDPDGTPLLSLTVIEDVTERKRVQVELAEQIERLHVTLHAIGEGVITTDEQGRVEYLNPVAEKLTGWTTAAARGMPSVAVFRIIDHATRLRARSPVETCLTFGRVARVAGHTMLCSRNCQEYFIEHSAAPIRNTGRRRARGCAGISRRLRTAPSESRDDVPCDTRRAHRSRQPGRIRASTGTGACFRS